MSLGQPNGLESEPGLPKMIGVVIMNAVGASASAGTLAKIMVLSLVGEVKMLTFL